jgi:hypothetical protein
LDLALIGTREFYLPQGEQPAELQRKPHNFCHVPCHDYLGHIPLLTMAASFRGAPHVFHIYGWTTTLYVDKTLPN